MSLEKNVDRVLTNYDFPMPIEWVWENGLKVKNIDEAIEIMGVLDDSGQFAPTFYDTINSEIVFGSHTDEGILPAFKNHIRKMDDKRKEDLLIALIHDILEEDFFDDCDSRIESMIESIENISGVQLDSVY